MSAPHPAFYPLHAHLSGAAELLAAQVPARTLSSLYPVGFASYGAHIEAFFAENPLKALRAQWLNLYQQADVNEVEAAFKRNAEELPVIWYPSAPQRVSQEHSALIARLQQLHAAACKTHSQRGMQVPYRVHHFDAQLGVLLTVMTLLESWDAKAFSGLLRQHRSGFRKATQGIAAFFEVPLTLTPDPAFDEDWLPAADFAKSGA